MRLKSLTFLLFFIFVILIFPLGVLAKTLPSVTPSPAPAIEYHLPFPGILPDHPLYFIKSVRDKILILVTREKTAKSQLYLLFADKHIAMASQLFEKNQKELAGKTLISGERYLFEAASVLDSKKDKSKLPEGLLDKLELAIKKHSEIIDNLSLLTEREEERQSLKTAGDYTNLASQKISLLKSM